MPESKKRRSSIKANWLNAPRPAVSPAKFLESFVGHPAPIDTNKDGSLDRKEIMAGMIAAGARDEGANMLLIDAYFDILDPQNTGLIRTDVFGRAWIRMGQYNAIQFIKQLINEHKLHMLTKSDGSRDVFFTKEEIQSAFEVQLGRAVAAKEVDSCFRLLDANNSSFMCSTELQNWYFSEGNADLRRISLRYRIRRCQNIPKLANCVGQQATVLLQVERHVLELETFIASLDKKLKKKCREKGHPMNIKLNGLTSRLSGILDFLRDIQLTIPNSNTFITDSVVLDAMFVPIRQAYALGATDPNAPPPPPDEDSEDD